MKENRKKEIRETLKCAGVWNEHTMRLHDMLVEAMDEVDRQGIKITSLILDHIASEGEWIGWTKSLKTERDAALAEVKRLNFKD